ncbi:MAG TPA: hypothetical protein VKE26_08785 [Xanthobacteraceae bacterium]|nr:hypothetical protein [Xanthobacteraceae bacterium]
MKIVQGDELDWVRGLEHRGGTFHYRNLMEGTPGTIDNFHLSMGRNDKDFVSPRHRHNFDQFRFQIEGDLNFACDGKMSPGMVGYFPEGAPYGPQTSEAAAMTIVLQFGGSSGSGYLSRHEVKQGMDELKTLGTFEAGVYRRNEGVPGKRNQDAYEAIWAQVNGRPLAYPKPRYPGPIMMDSADFSWVPTDAPGAAEKLLGIFTERRASARFVRLAAGATLEAAGRGIYVVCSGHGRVGGEPARRFTTLFLDHGEAVAFTAEQEMELLHLGLPDLRGLTAAQPEALPAEAAE